MFQLFDVVLFVPFLLITVFLFPVFLSAVLAFNTPYYFIDIAHCLSFLFNWHSLVHKVKFMDKC